VLPPPLATIPKTQNLDSLIMATTFHMPGGAFHAPHTTTPEGSPRVHPGLFRPPPQSPGMANPLFGGGASSTTPTESPTLFRPYFGQHSRPQQQPPPHQDFFQQQAQDQPRRQINTAVLRGPPAERPPLVSSPSAKRKRGPDGSVSLLNNEWSASSPVFGPVVTPTHAYPDGMGGGITGFDFGRRDAGFNPFGAFGAPSDGNLADSAHSDVDYRRTGGSSRPASRDADGDFYTGKPGQAPQPAPGQPGWFTLNTLGGVIGKVLDFCTAGAFRGFYAGGGRAYNIASDGTVHPVRAEQDDDEQAEFYDARQEPDVDVLPDAPAVIQHTAAATNVNNNNNTTTDDDHNEIMSPIHQDWPPPGFFPGGSRHVPVVSVPVVEVEPIPAPKRRQVAEASEELRNWVMVPEPDCQRGAAGAPAGVSPSASHGYRRSRFNPSVRRATGQQSLSSTSALPRRQFPKSLHTPRSSLAGAAFGLDPMSGQGPDRAVSPAPSTPSRIPVSAGLATANHVSSLPRPKPTSQIPTRPPSSASSYSTMSGLPTSGLPTYKPVATSFGAPSTTSSSHLSPHNTHRRNRSSVSQGPPTQRRPSFVSSMAGVPSTPAPPARKGGSNEDGNVFGSPHLTPEARQYARQRAQNDRETDVRMESINAQLEGLIRMGREALGSSIQVVDEGWMDED
jgi:hypothetical protein